MAEGRLLSKIAFRTDTNAAVGMGHLMRCLSIADALRDCGFDVVFIGSDESAGDYVRLRGFRLRVLGTEYDNMLEELPVLKHTLTEENVAVLVVDSYHVSAGYFQELRGLCQMVWIDDFMSGAMPVDVIVNYQIYADAEKYAVLYQSAAMEPPQLVLGPSAAPLRVEFHGAGWRDTARSARDVLVAVGGADPERMAGRFANELSEHPDLTDGRVFHFMLGSLDPDLEDLCGKSVLCPWIEIHENVGDVAALMSKMDVAISAAGTTLYELCACGVPTLAYCLSDDQVLPVRAFEQAGAVLFGGDYRRCRADLGGLVEQLRFLLENPDERRKLSRRARGITDGGGAFRIAEKLKKMIEEHTSLQEGAE